MSLDLSALFDCEPVAIADSGSFQEAAPQSNVEIPTTNSRLQDDEMGGLDLMTDDLAGGPVTDTGLPFGMQVDSYAEETITSLLKERDTWKAEAEKRTRALEVLERCVYKKVMVDADLPGEVVRRLNRLENENERYRSENKGLKESLKVAESEVVTLQDEIAGQKNKLKGAGKKVRNAKGVAGKQEEKATTAVHDKQLRAASERKMKQERNAAVAEAQALRKRCKDLQADLDVERSGRPHLRSEDDTSDTTTAVIPIELTIHRIHFLGLSTVLESNQISITEQMQHWYNDWKKPKEPTLQVVGANYMSSKKGGEAVINVEKLYADMVQLVDGHQQTGSEHDGPRSKHGLENICRKAEERHNF
jgi:hypothetical protein